METIFINTTLEIYKNGIKMKVSRDHLLYGQPIIVIGKSGKHLYWSDKYKCWFGSKTSIDYLLDKGSKIINNSNIKNDLEPVNQLETHTDFTGMTLKLYKKGIKVEASDEHPLYSQLEIKMGSTDRSLFWNNDKECWFGSKSSTDYLLLNGCVWYSQTLKSLKLKSKPESEYESESEYEPEPEPESESESEYEYEPVNQLETHADFTGMTLKLYKKGIKVETHDEHPLYAQPEIKMGSTDRSLFWNNDKKCWFGSKSSTDYLLLNGCVWYSQALKDLKSLESESEPVNQLETHADFTGMTLKLYKKGIKVETHDEHPLYAQPEIKMGSTDRSLFWNNDKECWFGSKSSIDYLLLNGCVWYSQAL